ncbi:hypothetical protein ACFLZB_04155 [Nanoarchaeota archaeon]
MKRKLIRQRDSLTVTLPKNWTDRFKLKGGEEIELDERDLNILVKAPGVKEKKETTFEITKKTKQSMYKTLLNHIYRKGYDKITIKFFSPNILPKIEGFVEKFYLGFAVVEKGKDYCIIENIAEPSEEKFDILIRRCFLIIKEMAEMLYQGCEKGKFEQLERLTEYCNNLDKFLFFCRRVVSKGFFSRGDSNLYWELLTNMMHVGRSYLSLGNYLSKQKKITLHQSVLGLFKRSMYFNSLIYDAYYQKDIGKIGEMVDLKDKLLYGPVFQIIEKTTGLEAVVVYHIRQTSRLIYNTASPVLAMLL